VKFISYFTDPENTNDEAFCFFTHLQSAVAFIDMMDASCLTITLDEFNRFMGLPPTSTADLDLDLMAQKKTSKKALQLLGVSPSTTVVMKKFGIDAKTAYTASTSPPGNNKSYRLTPLTSHINRRAATIVSQTDSPGLTPSLTPSLIMAASLTSELTNSPMGSPLPSLPSLPSSPSREMDLPPLADQRASAPIAINPKGSKVARANTDPTKKEKVDVELPTMTKSRSTSDLNGTWRHGVTDKKPKSGGTILGSDPVRAIGLLYN
jgi:hypothetical protein